jgi:cellulose synthase (UDP-forming)
LAIRLPVEVAIEAGSPVRISLFRGEREFAMPAAVVFNEGLVLRARFEDMSTDDYRGLVAATFSRADAWQNWLPERDLDRPLNGLREVLGVGLDGIRRFIIRIDLIARWRNLELWKR